MSAPTFVLGYGQALLPQLRRCSPLRGAWYRGSTPARASDGDIALASRCCRRDMIDRSWTPCLEKCCAPGPRFVGSSADECANVLESSPCRAASACESMRALRDRCDRVHQFRWLTIRTARRQKTKQGFRKASASVALERSSMQGTALCQRPGSVCQ